MDLFPRSMLHTPDPDSFLVRVNALVDWEIVNHLLAALQAPVNPALRPAIFRMLLLQQWYGLSDDEVLEACRDRLSFRWFLGGGVPLADIPPAEVAAFRASLARLPSGQQLFGAVGRQLAAHGVTIRRGAVVEAAVVPTAPDSSDSPQEATVLMEPGEAKRAVEAAMAAGAEAAGAEAGVPEAGVPEADTGPGAQSAPSPFGSGAGASVRAFTEWPWGASVELFDRLCIGRAPDFSVLARDLKVFGDVSRRHAELRFWNDGVWVRDLNSSNGTFVNGQAVPGGQAVLVDSDADIRFGKLCLVRIRLIPA